MGRVSSVAIETGIVRTGSTMAEHTRTNFTGRGQNWKVRIQRSIERIGKRQI